jgi:hypothetical protein
MSIGKEIAMAYNWNNELYNQSRRHLIDRTSLYLCIVAFIGVLALLAYHIGDQGLSGLPQAFDVNDWSLRAN